jgi:hypothetical protein
MTDRTGWIRKLLAIAETMPNLCPDMYAAGGYSEPGYSEPETGIVILANWNKKYNSEGHKATKAELTMPRLQALFEYFGAAVEWSDEWYVCSCGKCVRTKPDCYAWTPSYWMYDGEIECCECVESDPSGYIEYLTGNEDAASTMDVNLREHGFKGVPITYETGWHAGQRDNPSEIAESLRNLGVEKFIFQIDEGRQFDTSWSVWVHKTEYHLVKNFNK